MTNKVAFNGPQDRFVVTMDNKLIVITQSGDVFGHDVVGRGVGDAFKFTGSRAAFNGPLDRFVVTTDNKLIVITQGGDVFGHDIEGRHVRDPFKFTGSRAAFNGPQDRFVVTMDNMLIVITQSGDVFGHDFVGRTVDDPFKFTGSRAAFNGPQDRFVVTMDNKLIVITQSGDVFGHDIEGRHVSDPFKFTGSRAAFNGPQDRFVVTIDNKLLVITQSGDVFGHDINGRHIGDAFFLNPADDPLTLTLTTFECHDQSDEIRVLFGFNSEDDEPYAVVWAVDLRTTPVVPVPLGATNSKATLVGPLSDVDEGDETGAPRNVIWGLSDAPDVISSADNLIVLVAMMENDGSSPDQVRSVLEVAAQASLLQNGPAFVASQIPRQELVRRISAGMAGAMGLAKIGIPDPDDNIGSIQELRFFQGELDRIHTSPEPIDKSLSFEGDDAKYVLNFRLSR